MINKIDKNQERKKRQIRVRQNIRGTADRPRLNIYRSTNNIYAQLIDDVKGVTLATANTLQADVVKLIEGKTKTEAAKAVGQVLAERAKKIGVSAVVFDRAGYLYTGRVAAVAEGARAGGLEF